MGHEEKHGDGHKHEEKHGEGHKHEEKHGDGHKHGKEHEHEHKHNDKHSHHGNGHGHSHKKKKHVKHSSGVSSISIVKEGEIVMIKLQTFIQNLLRTQKANLYR